jgi:uncharacterized protein
LGEVGTYYTRPMAGPREPLEVDRLADRGADLDFTVPLAELSGLRALRAGVAGSVQGRVHFAREDDFAVADLRFAGVLSLQCQRCLQPMEWPVEADSRIALVASEAEAARVPPEREPVLAPAGRISLGELLTEELLLVLPIVPLHEGLERCTGETAPDEGVPQGETHRPFANLGDLLKR